MKVAQYEGYGGKNNGCVPLFPWLPGGTTPASGTEASGGLGIVSATAELGRSAAVFTGSSARKWIADLESYLSNCF